MTATTERLRQDSPRSRARLIRAFAVRDLKARFTATALGLLWTVIVPIASVLIYSAVFSLIFRAQAPPMGNGRDGLFAAWFFVGFVVWNTFSQVTMGGMGSILSMGAMLQKVYIPSYVPVFASAATLSVDSFDRDRGHAPLPDPLDECWLDLAVVPSRACRALGVRHGALVLLGRGQRPPPRHGADSRDRHAGLWFFLTPVMYPVALIPEEWNGIPVRSLLALNPMANFVEITRLLLYELQLHPRGRFSTAWHGLLRLAGIATFVYHTWGRDVGEAV